jgi:hypothetical protein
MRDAWDHNFAVERAPWLPQRNLFVVRGMGSGRMGNFAAYLEVRPGKIANSTMNQRTSDIQADVEHGRGPLNGMAEVTGTVTDVAGTALHGATIEMRAPGTAKPRVARSDDQGRFALSGIPPGEYEAGITSPGFVSASKRLNLAVRDRATGVAIGVVNGPVGFAGGGGGGGFGGGVFRVGGGVAAGQQGAVFGGVIGGLPALAPPPMAQLSVARLTSGAIVRSNIAPEPALHTRSWFPEALYINPEIVTDQNGAATVTIPIADSITTWRMAMLASTTHGALGSGSANIKVFQDFFTDLDLPMTLTQGDRVSIPVAIYNYTGAAGNVKLQLSKDDWYSLVEDSPEKTVAVESGRVGAAQFTIEAKRIGKFKLTLAARMPAPGNHADIVVREI